MHIKSFVEQNRADWSELEQYLVKLDKSRKHLSGREISIFSRIYQKTARDLSYSQTYFPEADVTAYLNELVAKSHNLLYKDQTSSVGQIRRFFSTTFVKLLTEQWKAILIAMLLFVAGAFAAFLSVLDDPLHLYGVLPEEVAQSVDPEEIDAGEGAVDDSAMSASIMTNNIQVGILAFAGGITFGLLTVSLLVYNGIMVGALAGLYWHAGGSYEFWAYIVPHGIVELTAIFIAGGAGLLMGYKLFVPGSYGRGYQLKYQAKRSVLLLIGTIPLFVIAGIIEGFITPANLSLETKYMVAFLTVAGLGLYVASGTLLIKRQRAKASLDS